jgi:hypothetical protein
MKVHRFSLDFIDADEWPDGTPAPAAASLSLYIGSGAMATEIPIYSPFVGYGDPSAPTVGLDTHSAEYIAAMQDFAAALPAFVATL